MKPVDTKHQPLILKTKREKITAAVFIEIEIFYISILTSGAKLSPPSRLKTAGSTNRIPFIEMRPRSRRFWIKYKNISC